MIVQSSVHFERFFALSLEILKIHKGSKRSYWSPRSHRTIGNVRLTNMWYLLFEIAKFLVTDSHKKDTYGFQDLISKATLSREFRLYAAMWVDSMFLFLLFLSMLSLI